MILSGIIRFYSIAGNLLYERQYHTVEGRKNIIQQFCENRENIYYHILPGYKYITKRVDVDKPIPIVRPKAEYNNVQIYKYK